MEKPAPRSVDHKIDPKTYKLQKDIVRRVASIVGAALFAYGRVTGDRDTEARLADYGRAADMQQHQDATQLAAVLGKSASPGRIDFPLPSGKVPGKSPTPQQDSPFDQGVLKRREDSEEKEEEKKEIK